MALADLAACTRLVQAFNPAAYTADADTFTAEIDTRGYYEALVIFNVGALNAAGPVPMTLHTSATSGGSFAAVTDGDFSATTSADQVKVARILCNGQNPFWKFQEESTGGTNTFGLSVLLIPYNTGDSDNTAMDFTL